MEGVFRKHPSVKDAALIGKPDEKWGEVGLMFVLLDTKKIASEESLKEFCQEKLARFKIPKEIIFVDSLPYSAYGKVEKTKLKDQFLPTE